MSLAPESAEGVETEPLTRSLVSLPHDRDRCSISEPCCALGRFHAPDQVAHIRRYQPSGQSSPADFPNWSCVHGSFTRFAACLHLRELHDRPRAKVNRTGMAPHSSV
jgi:hypothetical protein